MNHIQEETDGSRKYAASTESERTTGRGAPDNGCATKGCTRQERSRAAQGWPATDYGREDIEGCGS
jgi:hypothetical protein